jgi:crossover junction endodeoxyribonuclease RusA
MSHKTTKNLDCRLSSHTAHSVAGGITPQKSANEGARTGGVQAFTLPYPPSVNHYWKPVRGRLIVSRAGRLYRTAALSALIAQGVSRESLKARLRVALAVHTPDRRRRDLDNLTKALLDALVMARIIEDDGQIDELHVIRQGVQAGGVVHVTLTPLLRHSSSNGSRNRSEA